jgi:hypothetical protein
MTLPDPESLLPPERDPSALLAQEPLNSYIKSLLSTDYAKRAGPLGMLRLLDPIATALRAYERQLVAAALVDGASWSKIGDALSMSRSNAYNRHKHVADEYRETKQ